MDEFNVDEVVKNQFPTDPLKEVQLTIQSKAPQKADEGFVPVLPKMANAMGGFGLEDTNKASLTKQIPVTEGYNLVGDEWISKYPTYKEGRDNAEYAALNQTTWDKWANGLTKASANFATTVVGNTVGLIVGAGNGIAEGSFNAVFDNNFSNALADWNEKLGYQLPNYVSKQEKEEGFIGSLNNANFWANDVMGGLSFTLGTVVSEAIWAAATGGTANAAKWGLEAAQASKWGKGVLGLGRAVEGVSASKGMLDDFARNVFSNKSIAGLQDDVIKAAERGKWLNTARFLATTSGNEAGIEALHYKREARENFYGSFEELNGRKPTTEEIAEFENNNENAANAVFASNMAILIPSNAVMFGKMFKIASPFKGITRSVDKSIFGVGVEKTAEGAFKGIEASKKQIGARWAYALGKGTVSEGLFEEGLQGVTSNSAKNWISSTYDPKYNNESISLMDATYKAFGQQYGTKEGWKEIGIGGIIGTGMSVIEGGGLPADIKEFKEKQKYQDEFVAKGFNRFGDGSSTATTLLTQKMMMNARVKSALDKEKTAIKNGDDVGAMLAGQEPLIAELQFRKTIGEDTKSLVKKYEIALDAMPKEAWEEAGITDIEEYKKGVLSGYQSLVANFEKANDFANAIIGDSSLLGEVKNLEGKKVANQQLKDALTYSIVSGQTANKAMDTILVDFSKILGEDSTKALSVQREVERLGKNKQAQIRTANKNIAQAEAEEKSLSQALLKLEASKDENKGERLAQVRASLLETTDRLSTLRQEREDLAQEVSQESKRRRTIGSNSVEDFNLTQDFITGENLANIDQKLENINNAIKNYEGNNHELYYELLELQKQYSSAKEKYLDYQNAIDAIVTGKFQPQFKKVEGVLGKVFNLGTKPMDDFTTEFLEETYGNYIKTMNAEGVEGASVNQNVSDEEYQIFKDTGVASDEVKVKIAEKVKAKAELDSREKEIYATIQQEVNEILTPNPNKPDLTPNVEVVENLTDAEKLRKEIEKTFQKSYPLLTTDVDELIADKPTKEQIERYLELYKQRNKFDLFLQKEFDELQPKMQKWFMAQSLPIVAGRSIADVVEILAQLETQVEKEDTITEVDSEEMFAGVEDARELNRVDVLQNMSGSAVAKVKDGKLFVTHVKAKNVLDKLIQSGAVIMQIQTISDKNKISAPKDLTNELLNKNYNKPGTIFQIGEVKVTIGERGSLVFDLENFNTVASDILNMYYYDAKAGKWSYIDLYTEVDGKKIKMLSEFETNTSSDAIYDVEVGDDLELFVDMNLEWNYDLKVKALEEVDKDGVISEETKQEIFNNLNITSRKDKVNNSTLKGTQSEEVNDNFLLVRKRFADKFIELIETEQALATLPKKIELDVEVPIEAIYLGTPEFILGADNKPMDIPITPRGFN